MYIQLFLMFADVNSVGDWASMHHFYTFYDVSVVEEPCAWNLERKLVECTVVVLCFRSTEFSVCLHWCRNAELQKYVTDQSQACPIPFTSRRDTKNRSWPPTADHDNKLLSTTLILFECSYFCRFFLQGAFNGIQEAFGWKEVESLLLAGPNATMQYLLLYMCFN